jgi:hypothetical protein
MSKTRTFFPFVKIGLLNIFIFLMCLRADQGYELGQTARRGLYLEESRSAYY